MTIKIQPRGIERVLERLEQMGDTTHIERALDQAAQIVERDAALHAPIDTGQMRSSIYVDTPSALKRVVGSDDPQSVFTEYAPQMLKHGTVANPRRGPWPYFARDSILGGVGPVRQRRRRKYAVVRDSGPDVVRSALKRKGTNPNATMPWLRPALYRNRRKIVELIQRAIGRRNP